MSETDERRLALAGGKSVSDLLVAEGLVAV